MKKPHHGDLLTIRYQGAILRATCDGVTEVSARAPGAANFSIVSQTVFERGREAHLLQGQNELPIQVLRVTTVGHQRVNRTNVVLFSAIFEQPVPVNQPAPNPV